jgi:hypothetical protein
MIVAKWSLRMALELACRYLFVAADGPNHDLHHLYPRSSWANHVMLRPQVEARRAKLGQSVLSEIWGFSNTLRTSLEAMSKAKPC